MLFTNKTLEINNIEKDGKTHRQLELYNIYGSRYYTHVDSKMTDKIKFVKNNVTHLFLDIDKVGTGFMFKNTKSDKLTIVLDMLDYKQFFKDSKIEVSEDSEIKFEKVKECTLVNRINTKWTVTMLEVVENGKGILRLTTTSGRVSYLIVLNKKVVMVNSNNIESFLKENNISIDINKTKWNLV